MKFKYWLTSLTDISNAKKKLLYDCSITAEKLFFMPKNELFDILFFTARSAVFSGCHGWAEHAVKGIVLPRGFRFAGRRRIDCLHRKA